MFKKRHMESEKKTTDNPLCWGYQEYGDRIRKLARDKQIDVNNHRDHYMLIQKFLVDHIDGIKMRRAKIASHCNG